MDWVEPERFKDTHTPRVCRNWPRPRGFTCPASTICGTMVQRFRFTDYDGEGMDSKGHMC